jgi:hypothetical protein
MRFWAMGISLKFYIRRSVCYHTNANLAKMRLTGVKLGELAPQNRFLIAVAQAAG